MLYLKYHDIMYIHINHEDCTEVNVSMEVYSGAVISTNSLPLRFIFILREMCTLSPHPYSISVLVVSQIQFLKGVSFEELSLVAFIEARKIILLVFKHICLWSYSHKGFNGFIRLSTVINNIRCHIGILNKVVIITGF